MPKIKRNLLEAIPFTTIPDNFLAFKMAELSPSELKVMLYIFLHTLGYGKLSDAISYDQFINGITTREGTRLDCGAGVSRRALVAALNSLEHRHHLISRSHHGYAVATIRLELASLSKAPLANGAPIVLDNSAAVTALQAIPLSSCAELIPLPKSSQLAVLESDLASQEEEEQTLPFEGQKLPFSKSTGVQSLPLTKESFQNHENHENRVKPEVVLALSDLTQKATITQSDLPEQIEANQTDLQFAAKVGTAAPWTVPTTQVEASQIGPQFERTNPVNQAIELIVNNVAGISTSEATNLVKLAFSPERRRDLAYIQRLVAYVTGCEKLRTPAAVLTVLIQTDQDRTKVVSKAKTSLKKKYPKARHSSASFDLGKYAYLTTNPGPSDTLNSSQGDMPFEKPKSLFSPGHKEGDRLWQQIQEDLRGRYRLAANELELFTGSTLYFEKGGEATVVLASVWQQRELGLASRSAVALALRQRLGVSCELKFTCLSLAS